jgi:hypothetical protein
MCDFLSDTRDTIDIGPAGDEQIVLSGRPVHFTLPKSINEDLLEMPELEDGNANHDLIDESSDSDDN